MHSPVVDIHPGTIRRTPAQARLFPNAQFLYEFRLAQLELQSLGAEPLPLEDFSGFDLLAADGGVSDQVLRRSAYVESVDGRRSDYATISTANVTRSVNQYLTHWIYPYKGKFHPQMVRALLNILGLRPGDTVADPFVGSGTTALEAQLLGINSVGFDISPVCVLQGRVKTESLHVAEAIAEETGRLLQSDFATVGEALDILMDGRYADERMANFFRLAALLTIGDRRRRRRRKPLWSLRKNLRAMRDSVLLYRDTVERLGLSLGNVVLREADARSLPLPDASVDGIITSPPYSIALDYLRNDSHAMEALGVDESALRQKIIGLEGNLEERIERYYEDMRRAYAEMARILKPGKMAAVVIGDARRQGKVIPTVAFTVQTLEELGLRRVHEINKIIFGLYNVMKLEKVLIFRKTVEPREAGF